MPDLPRDAGGHPPYRSTRLHVVSHASTVECRHQPHDGDRSSHPRHPRPQATATRPVTRIVQFDNPSPSARALGARRRSRSWRQRLRRAEAFRLLQQALQAGQDDADVLVRLAYLQQMLATWPRRAADGGRSRAIPTAPSRLRSRRAPTGAGQLAAALISGGRVHRTAMLRPLSWRAGCATRVEWRSARRTGAATIRIRCDPAAVSGLRPTAASTMMSVA